MENLVVGLLNGVSAGLLLFVLSAGLTLIFGMMGVLNFAHASFYMLGAYLGYSLSRVIGFWPALAGAPLLVGLAGALFERGVLRGAHRSGHVAQLLVTFGASYVVIELVQLLWGRSTLAFMPPPVLQGAAFMIGESSFPATRAFMMAVALAMLVALWLVITRTRIGLVIQAALTHPEMAEALGHDVPRLFTLVFGAGCALAGLAGVVGGITFVTEPAMAAVVGAIVFVVVVVGGMGSLAGAFIAAMLIGLLQTLPLGVDALASVAPLFPYALLVLVLLLRPQGLLGTRVD